MSGDIPGIKEAAMPLSENEQRILDELEKQLRSDDPSLANAFSDTSGTKINKKRLGIGAVGVFVGLAILVFAVWQHAIWLGVLAFILMVASATFGLSSPRATPAHQGDPRSEHPAFGRGVPHSKSKGSKGKTSGFMRTLEERWDRRDQDRR